MRDIFNFELLGADAGDTVNQIDGTNGADTLDGTAADDHITGGAGDDILTDSAGGDDILSGGTGNDTITVTRDAASTGKVRIFGGAGADTISFDGAAGNQVTLNISAGPGANLIDVSHAHDANIHGGNGIDTVSLSTQDYALAHTGGGDDELTVSSDNADARTGISTGKGADTVTLETDNGAHYRMKLGDGADVVHLNASTDDSLVKLVFKDFQAGAGGDNLELDQYLNSVLDHFHKGDDPFASGFLRLVDGHTADGREAAVLEIDMDGAHKGATWEKLAVFIGVSAADLTSDNLGGLDPVVAASSDHLVV
jgi:Ca2+-binding RTX toxin-like protein